MKKKIILLVVLGILILFGIKYTLIIPYHFSTKEQKKLNKIDESLLIKDFYSYIKNTKENSITYKKLTIEKLDDFECENKEKLICSKDKISISIEEKPKFIDLWNTFDKDIKKDNKINTDLLLFGYVKDSIERNSILLSTKDIKQDYLAKKFALKYLSNFYSIDLINGDIQGYMFHVSSNKREIHIESKNNNYKITLNNLNYFNKNKIQELINSIEINVKSN